jgi:hypothetical protein
MQTNVETLQIDLQDALATSWWKPLLGLLATPHGGVLLRFVGRVPGEHRPRYTSGTFQGERPFRRIAPQEAWACGMTAALDELRHELAADGWVEIGRGDDTWAYRYERRARVPASA